MRWKKTLTMIEAHAEGEVGRVVTSVVNDIPGVTMLEKMNFINQVDDSLRRFLVFEPRGYAQMSTNLIFEPTTKEADIGFIILQDFFNIGFSCLKWWHTIIFSHIPTTRIICRQCELNIAIKSI